MLHADARRYFRHSLFFPVLAACWALGIGYASGQDTNLPELTDDEQRQVQIAERFLSVLEKNPRRGTALDRIYGHHVEFGTLDNFLQSLRDRVAKAPTDGVGWMLLGLFEAHRGDDAHAIDALRKADALRPQDGMASYYLGQSLLLLGQAEEAVAAMERAIERKPPRADLLEIFQQLGRVHQRAQRTEEALRVWQRLEELFPDDPRVQEQIAVTLVEEGQYAQALPRYEKLAQLVRDDYRRTMFRIEAAELKIRENRGEDGLADFERLLLDLNPTSWLYRDVRRRVEEVFLRTGNQDGLVGYYEKWIGSHPEDVDAMARLARFLAASARVPEATEWMAKALQKAPTRTELRKAFIDQLVDDQRYPEAVKQYELLVESAPGNPDFLRDWGKLVLKNRELAPEARQAEAARIWRRITAARPDDALTAAQVADLFRQSNMNEDALALYQRAVELAPNDPQYREYLGEFYHILKRPADALKVWTTIAEGPRRTALNVSRLAEILNSFGYLNEAVREIADACRLDPKDFALQLKAAEYHNRADKFDEALSFLLAAEKIAANTDEQDSIIAQRIEVFRSSHRLENEIDALAAAVRGNASATMEQYYVLARYNEADSRWADATEAIDQAMTKDPRSVRALTAAARIAEMSGDYARAADMNRQLAAVDRRSRGDHLMNVARLEAQLGRSDQALQAARELILSAPGNTDNYEFYARLCFQLGKTDEGVDTLRKAVRINPTEPHLITALGAALTESLRTDEAIEVYWRAFEKTEDLDDKTNLTAKLTELYLQVNQWDKLLERLERDRREENKRREMTICLAQAHHTAGDFGSARLELESLLAENTRDTNLLQQLSKLCEQGSDLDGAVEYQRQLASVAPGHETEYRLAGLLQSRGDRDEASEILRRLMSREEDPTRRLRSIDSLLKQGGYEEVISITEPLLSEQRDDWELLYREAVAWASLEKSEEAEDRFERILTLTVPYDELGVAAVDKFKQAQARARSDNLRGIQSSMPQRRTPLMLLSATYQVRQAAGLDPDRSFRGSQLPDVWTPDAYGEARIAAYGWLMRLDQDRETAANAPPQEQSAWQRRLAQLESAAAANDASRESLYDWMYVEQLRGNMNSVFTIARRLAKSGGREEQQFFLSSLRLRDIDAASQQAVRSRNENAKPKPLSDEDLDLMLTCYHDLNRTANLSDDSDAVLGGQIAYGSNGQAYIQIAGQWVPIAGGRRGAFVGQVIEELKLAGREKQAEELLQQQLADAKSAEQLSSALRLLVEEDHYERLAPHFDRWVEMALRDIAKGPAVKAGRSSPNFSQVVDPLGSASGLFLNWMGQLGPEEEHARIFSILDACLDINAEVARKRRVENTARRRSSSSRSQYYGQSYALKYGKEDLNVRIEYPNPNEHVDTNGLMLLRQVYEILQRNDSLSELPQHLEKRLAASAADTRLHATLLLAYARWWLEERDEALVLLKQAGTLLPDDPEFRLEIAGLHLSMGDFDDALEIIESVVPRDQQLVQQRELMVLGVAERLGDLTRARQSAERLFGLRLDESTQLELVERMRRLGMHELAEAIVSRMQRRSGNSLSSMGSLMALYQGQGKSDLAQQLAHSILQRTRSPLLSMSAAGRNPFRYTSSNADSQMRAQALRLLQQTGTMPTMIARLEDQLARSPGSVRLYDELIEFSEISNDREKVASLLKEAIAARPDAVIMQYKLAKLYESTGKVSEACDLYLEVLKQKPQWMADDLYQVRRIFERANRAVDLIKAVESINIKQFSHPYYVIDLVTNMFRAQPGQASQPGQTSQPNQPTQENQDLAIKLLEKVFDAFPTYRNQLLSRMYDQNLWKNDRIFALGKRALTPTDAEVAGNPWFGVHQIYSYSSGGQVNAQFHQILRGVQGSNRVEELRRVIAERLQEAPGWHGGEAMLALIDLKGNKKAEAKQRLQALVSKPEEIKSMPNDACWIIGQELDQFDETKPIALKLFETASNNPDSMSQIQYSPIARLVGLYANVGRKEEARDLLLKRLTRNSGEYDLQYGSYVYVENAVWVGQQLLKLEYPVDSVRIFRELSSNSTMLEQAGTWYGSQPNYFKAQVDTGLNAALKALDGTNAADAIAQLLRVPEKLRPGAPVLDLMLITPNIADFRTKPMTSPMVDLLVTVSKDETIAKGVRAKLVELHEKYPEDLSIEVLAAAYELQQKGESIDESLQRLQERLLRRPLTALPPGRHPNSKHRREAGEQIPLWLIARECLKLKDREPTGTMLGERALAAARRQTGDLAAAAILFEWGKIALERGDRAAAEAKWSELLDIVTRRPERKQLDLKTQSRHQPGGVRAKSLDVGRRALTRSSLATSPAKPGEVFLGRSTSPAKPDRSTSPGLAGEVLNRSSTSPGLAGEVGPTGRVRAQSPDTVLVVLQQGTDQRNPSSPAKPAASKSAPAKPSASKPAAAPPQIPPLTISQFRVAMEIAIAAADNNMPALSRKAVQASMQGGIPVEDNADLTGGPGQPRVSSSMDSGTESNLETEVAESLRKVIRRWQGDQYPAEQVYNLLVPIVFPETRPGEILLYADSSKLKDAKVSSLGGELVDWSRRAQTLDQLAQRIAERQQNPPSKVPALVLRTRIGLAKPNLQEAEQALTELSQLVEKGTLPAMVELACHAALPATDVPELNAPAFTILRSAIRLQFQTVASQQFSNESDLTLGGLVSIVNRYLAKNPDDVKQFFEDYLVGRQTYYSRYSGTYGQYLQWRDWAVIAEEAAKVGIPSLALDFMGRVADFTYERNQPPSTPMAMAVVCRELNRLPAEQRYETWRDWTLPSANRKSVRLVGEWVQPVRVPASVLQHAVSQGPLHAEDILSNVTELVASAAACNRLPELKTLAQEAYDQKLPHAPFLLGLVLIELGDQAAAAQVIDPLWKTVRDRLKPMQPPANPWGDYLVYRACMRSPQFVAYYEPHLSALKSALQSLANSPLLSHLQIEFALRARPAGGNATGAGPSGTAQTTPPRKTHPGEDPQLAYWFPAPRNQAARELIDSWWTVQEGQLAHLAGSGTDLLYFNYPVTGEFEFHVDAFRGSWAETDVGYGGVLVESQRSNSQIRSVSGHESVSKPGALNRRPDTFGSVTIQVQNGKLRYRLNDHLVYEEELSGTSPWITLFTDQARATTFRNPRFSGTPVIPREVTLIHGNRMDGWNTSFFNESQPRHRTMAITSSGDPFGNSVSYAQRQEPSEFDWRVNDGVLVGRQQPDSQASDQSWVYYHRPLRDQETFRYEFHYVPTETVAHPTVGQLALCLEPDGVVEHWVGRPGWDDSVLGIPIDNRHVNAQAQRGPKSLPLRANDWNKVSMTLAGQTITLTLNGEEIYARELEPELDRRFGLYRSKSQTLKVRMATLSGKNWPETLSPDINESLLASTKSPSQSDRRLANRILGERFSYEELPNVMAQARQLPAEQAYERLLAWVLPSIDHPQHRLYFQFAPVTTSGQAELLCPAWELVAIADRVGKRESLAKAISAADTGKPASERPTAALHALLAIHAADIEAAKPQLARLYAAVSKGFPKEMTIQNRSPELVAAWQAAQVPGLQYAAYDLAHAMQTKQRNADFAAADGRWQNSVNLLVGQVDRAMRQEPSVPDSRPQLTQWTNVPYYKPDMKDEGLVRTEWAFQPGAVHHVAGGTWGQLYFQSPLRGNFEIVARRGLHGHREMAIAYGMHSAEPRYDWKAKRITKLMHFSRDDAEELRKPDTVGWLADFRIRVQDSQITTFVNDVKLHEETLTGPPDPWLVLQSHNAGYQSTVRDLRILGQPTIPDEINLIDIAGWASWRADMYGESFATEETDSTNPRNSTPWQKAGDEIVGQLRQNTGAEFLESLLMYQRPMLEDGVIEFESYFVPGEIEVHPAVGRTALLVRADGVRRHKLTLAQYERSGLSPGNESAIDGASHRVELKTKDWNKFRLTLKGDQLTLAVNGQDVALVTLTEPASERFFGLFRYSHKTQCRVRNLVYRGEWPKSLPVVSDQQLAAAWTGQSAKLAAPQVISCRGSAAQWKEMGWELAGEPSKITVNGEGTRLLLTGVDKYEQWPRLHRKRPIAGDFAITLDFDQMKFSPVKAGWGSNFNLRAIMEEGPGVTVECGIGMNNEGRQHLQCARRHKSIANADEHDGRYQPQTVESGRLRLVRTGGSISTWYAPKGSEAFELLETWPVGSGPVREIVIMTACSDTNAMIDVLLKQVTVQFGIGE